MESNEYDQLERADGKLSARVKGWNCRAMKWPSEGVMSTIPRGHSHIPFTRQFLRFGNLTWTHVIGQAIAPFFTLVVSMCRCQVVPHMRSHEIMRHPVGCVIKATKHEHRLAVTLISR